MRRKNVSSRNSKKSKKTNFGFRVFRLFRVSIANIFLYKEMIQLEKYRGRATRHACPSCRQRYSFVRYVNERGEYLSAEVGRCNRESRCGYHYKPKDFYRDNPQFETVKNKLGNAELKFSSSLGIYKNLNLKNLYSEQTERPLKKTQNKQKQQPLKKESIFDTVPFEYLKATLGDYEQNAFVKFLLNLFPDDLESVKEAIQKYCIGTWEGKTVFWQIDQSGRIRTGQLIKYDDKSGKRMSEFFTNKDGERIEIKTNWMHARLKKQGKLNTDFQLRQCFFGEHLLRKEPHKPVAIVEAAKTAIICSICFPEVLWLAVGAKGYLTDEKFKIFAGRKVLLFPDADAYTFWQEKAVRAHRNGFDVHISSLIETQSTGGEKETGFDLADYLVAEQSRINQHNSSVDNYNEKLDKVLIDKSLIRDFETILDEQKAILMIDGNLSETQAESYITKTENIRSRVLEV